ncbi:hypothetical protein H6504_01950 [Candidatus Woesearchaeota archaeon]|nr:hypothetical protein [Candidatus Woesearchaeota archaeon]
MLGSLILVGIFIGITAIIFASVGDQFTKRQEVFNQQVMLESYGLYLDSALQVYEPVSNRPFGELLGSAVYFGQNRFDGETLTIPDQFGDLLDYYLEDRPYYIEINPIYYSLELIFVLDGGRLIEKERVRLANESARMESIIREQSGFAFTDVKVLVIAGDDPNVESLKKVDPQFQPENITICDNFTIPCSYLTYDDVFYTGSNDLYDLKQFQYNMTVPDHAYEAPDAWRNAWESGTLTQIVSIPEDPETLRIYMPMTATLPTASTFVHSCPIDFVKGHEREARNILHEYNSVMMPIIVTPPDVDRFCYDQLLSHIDRILENTGGFTILHTGALVEKINRSISDVVKSKGIHIGKKRTGSVLAYNRYLPMPNGQLAALHMEVYVKSDS